jgi:pilus assembly protein CpaF
MRESMSLTERLSFPTNGLVDAGASDEMVDVRNRVHQVVIETLGTAMLSADVDEHALIQRLNLVVDQALAAEEVPLSRGDREGLAREIADEILGYGPLQRFLKDETVTEIMVNNHREIYIERGGRIFPTDAHFADDSHLRRTLDKIVAQVGRRIDESSAMVDARLPDGSRVNAIIPPLSLNGPAMTIRKFATRRLSMGDLVGLGTLSEEMGDFIGLCVRARLNILVTGGTGSGKTTMLNILSSFIPEEERIVTIEDAAELRLSQRHVISLEARPANIEGKGQISIRDLVKNALRMRPDRIIVGECRGAETVDMLQAMNTGHEGSLTTIHANSPRDALARTETLVLTAGFDLPLKAIRDQIASAFDLIIHTQRLVDGRRRITHITEVPRVEGDVITLTDIFVAGFAGDAEHDRVSSTMRHTGIRPAFIDKLERNGVSLPKSFFNSDTSAKADVLRRGQRRSA